MNMALQHNPGDPVNATILIEDDGSGNPPVATAESQCAHQWYVTCTNPPTTISAGGGPGGNGLFLATAVNGFLGTEGDLAIQARGVTKLDSVGPLTVKVTGAIVITTPTSIDLSATGIVKVTAGSGTSADPLTLCPGTEGGEIGSGEVPSPAPGGTTYHAPGSSGGSGPGGEKKPRPKPTGSKVGATASNIIGTAAGPGGDVVAGIAGIKHGGGLDIGLGVGVFVAEQVIGAVAHHQMAADEAGAEKALAALEGDGDAAAAAAASGPGGPPDIDMFAAQFIKGKATSGIKWETPAAILSKADTAIRSVSPVIEQLANSVIKNVSDVLIEQNAGTELKQKAGALHEVMAPLCVTKAAAVVDISAGAAVGINAIGMISMNAVKSTLMGAATVKVESYGKALLEGKALAEVKSHGVAKVEGKAVAQVKGKIAMVSADAIAKVEGKGLLSLRGGKINVNGDALTKIDGGLVKLG